MINDSLIAILPSTSLIITVRKSGLSQIYSVQIWYKKVQTRGKSKAKIVNTAFACQFTWGCRANVVFTFFALYLTLVCTFFAPNLQSKFGVNQIFRAVYYYELRAIYSSDKFVAVCTLS